MRKRLCELVSISNLYFIVFILFLGVTLIFYVAKFHVQGRLNIAFDAIAMAFGIITGIFGATWWTSETDNDKKRNKELMIKHETRDLQINYSHRANEWFSTLNKIKILSKDESDKQILINGSILIIEDEIHNYKRKFSDIFTKADDNNIDATEIHKEVNKITKTILKGIEELLEIAPENIKESLEGLKESIKEIDTGE